MFQGPLNNFEWTIALMVSAFGMWLFAYGLAKVIQLILDARTKRIQRRHWL